jgi:hypothetical protein
MGQSAAADQPESASAATPIRSTAFLQTEFLIFPVSRGSIAICSVVVTLAAIGTAASAPVIWTGPTITVAKSTLNGDPTLEVNQDHLTNNVILTRGFSQGMFNIAQEHVGGRPWPVPNSIPSPKSGSLLLIAWSELAATSKLRGHGKKRRNQIGEIHALHTECDNSRCPGRHDNYRESCPRNVSPLEI